MAEFIEKSFKVRILLRVIIRSRNNRKNKRLHRRPVLKDVRKFKLFSHMTTSLSAKLESRKDLPFAGRLMESSILFHVRLNLGFAMSMRPMV